MDDLLDSVEMVSALDWWPLHKHCHRSDEAREMFKQSLILHFIVSHTQPTQAIQEENGRCEGEETSEYYMLIRREKKSEKDIHVEMKK